MTADENHDEPFQYGDPNIASAHAPVPTWLVGSYLLWIGMGILWAFLYWNGSWGFLDPGSWGQLQQAANTTFKF